MVSTYPNQPPLTTTRNIAGKMSENMEHKSITHDFILPARYDPRIVVKPCQTARVPYLPVEIIYQIAEALPQPRQVFNLALASKETWEYLQPALFKCEVTYEARLIHLYGGESSASLRQHHEEYPRERDKFKKARSGKAPLEDRAGCQQSEAPAECEECEGQIALEDRTFEGPNPENLLSTDRPMTALHWASTQGPSALPVAKKAIRAALAHQPSYINGTNLKVRKYLYLDHRHPNEEGKPFPADLPPPLFLAVAHGNTDVVKALIDAGCDLNLLQGQGVYIDRRYSWPNKKLMMGFKIHKECLNPGRDTDCFCESWNFDDAACHTVGHVAVHFGQTELLEMLLRRGLDAKKYGSRILQYAVEDGKLAALRALRARDPCLTCTYCPTSDETNIHKVESTRQGFDSEDDRRERIRDMIMWLLEYGADLEGRHGSYLGRSIRDTAAGQLTALGAALESATGTPLEYYSAFTALDTAEFLISMGAVWNQEMRSTGFGEEHLLKACVDFTVTLWIPRFVGPYAYLNEGEKERLESNKSSFREIRQAMGRVIKAIIEQAAWSISEGNSVLERDADKAAFSEAFSYLADHNPDRDVERGPFATEAVGRLLLSTGITPSDEEMRSWRAQIVDPDEAMTDRGERSDAGHEIYVDHKCDTCDECDICHACDEDYDSDVCDDGIVIRQRYVRAEERAEDGDKGQWAFLLSGIEDERFDNE